MRSIQGVWPLVRERLAANWQLLAVLAFGMLVAATLLAASPIYTRVMSDLGLEYSLKERLRSVSRAGAIQFGLPLGTQQAAAERLALAEMLDERLSWLTDYEVRYAAVQRDMTHAVAGQPVPTGAFRTTLTLQTVSGLEERVRIVEGRMPTGRAEGGKLEVALPAEAASFLGVGVGDSFLAVHSYDDCNRLPPTDDPEEIRERMRFPCVPQTFVTLRVEMVVVGIIEQLNPEDPYWSAAGRLTFQRPMGTDEQGAIAPVVFSEEGFHQGLAQILPGIPSEFRTTSVVDITRLNSSNINALHADLQEMRALILARDGIGDFPMIGAIEDFTRRSSFNQVPLLILLLQVVGISIYYVVLVASMLVERRSEEIAMLRSRGASVAQVTQVAAMEAVILGLAAAAIAPFLAAGIVSLLGLTGTFASVSGGEPLPFTLLPIAFLYALGGAALAMFAVIVPTFFMARRSMVQFLRGAARPQRSFIQRYYIDIAFAGLAAYAFYELNQRGSVFDPRSVGGWSADPLLLLSPLILMLAVGTLLFRFLPLALSVATRFARPTAGAGTILALWQLTRSPGRYTQLALLVIMAGAIGTFAATYGSTTDRSQEERGLYEVGVDLRTTSLGNVRTTDPVEIRQRALAVEGVEDATPAFRGAFNIGPLPGFGSPIDVLGVDPQLAASFLWFREDFAPESLEDMMRRIYGSPSGGAGIGVPGEPVAITAWVNPAPARNATTLWVRTRDSAGMFRMHELGQVDFEGYRQLTAQLHPERDNIVYPISIVGLLITQPQGISDAGGGQLYIDDIEAIDRTGEVTLVDDFEGAFRWQALRTATRNRDNVNLGSQGQRRGQGALQISFRIGTSVNMRGAIVADANLPVPAIASERFLASTGLRVGHEVELVVGGLIMPVSIRGVTGLFPSMGNPGQGYLIINQEHLYYFTGLTNQTSSRGPTELWMQLPAEPAERALTVRNITGSLGIASTNIIDREDVLNRVRTDPVIRAGGSGILFIALVAALAILALGFGLSLYVGGQLRTVEMSVLRAVGLSRSHVFAMVTIEYVIVAVVGLAVGTFAGLRISHTMLSFLNVTEQGGPLIPPFALETRWDTLGIAFSFVAVAFVAGIVILAVYFLRVPVSRILRLTR